MKDAAREAYATLDAVSEVAKGMPVGRTCPAKHG